MPSPSRAFLVALSLLAAVPAQTCYYTHSSDPRQQLNENPYARLLFLPNSANGTSQRSQVLISRLAFQNVPVLITSIAVAPALTEQVTYRSLEIWLGYTNREAVSSRFADNPSGVMTKVLDVRQHVWTCRLWSWTETGLQQPFLYVPAAGNLLIEVVATRAEVGTREHPILLVTHLGGFRALQSTFTGATLPDIGAIDVEGPKLQICTERANLDYFGVGCPGSGSTRPAAGLTGSGQIGQTASFWLSNAPPSTAAMLVLGTSNRAPVYPIDLAPLGMPECRLYLSPDLGLSVGTDGLGIARVPLAIPNQQTLVASIVYGQFFVVDPTGNARGLTASNYARILIGL